MRRRDRISAPEALLLGRFHVLSNKPVLSSREQDEFANVKGSLSRAPSLELLSEAYLNTFGSTLDLSPDLRPSDDMGMMNQVSDSMSAPVIDLDSPEYEKSKQFDDEYKKIREHAHLFLPLSEREDFITKHSTDLHNKMFPREEVSVGGQTYMLPRDPVARDKFRKSLMQQQIEKDQKVASSAVFPGRMETVETMTDPAMFADMRGRSAYDVGYRMGLDATENTGMMTLDDVAGAGETAQKYRESLGSRSGTQRGSMSPRDIERLGYLEAMEAAEQKLMDEDRMYLQEGISFQPAADKIVVEEGL